MADHERKAVAARAPDFHVFDGTMELKGHCLSLTRLMIAVRARNEIFGLCEGHLTSLARHRARAGRYPSRSKTRRPASGDELPCQAGRLQSEDQRSTGRT